MIHPAGVAAQLQPRAFTARGFTLIEVMVAVMILAILVTIAVPSFNNASLSSKLGGYANDLVAGAQLARSEAIKRNVNVTLCASEDGDTCGTTEGWEVGWIVIADTTPDDTVVDRHGSLPDEFRVIAAGGVEQIVFPPTVAGTTIASLTVCRADPVGSQERVVSVRASGSTQVTRTSAGNCPD
jgi:type IV fimbrial biogenesis protein FimT